MRALPHLSIGWANLQWPPSGRYTLSVNGGLTVYGQVWIAGATEAAGPTPSLDAQLGFGPAGSDPHAASWTWQDAGFNGNAGNNDEFVATINPQQAGSYDYAYRYSTTAGRDWVYADLDGSPNGYSPAQAGKLTVDPSGDTTAAPRPGGPARRLVGPGLDLARLGSGDGARPVRLRGPQGRCARGAVRGARADDGTYIHRRHRRAGAYIHIRHPLRGHVVEPLGELGVR